MTQLRTGITTGTCATAAAFAAAQILSGHDCPEAINVELPNGDSLTVPVLFARLEGDTAIAAVRKDAGDDPDVTDGMDIVAMVTFVDNGDVTFKAGPGVGVVTKPGLQIPPGQPAINPVPRKMIASAIRQLTDRPVSVEISIPGGQAAAAKTFNPRLGIEGGLSVLGTTGIVRPYCRRAMHDAIACALDVAQACGVTALVLVPGNIGTAGCKKHFQVAEQQLIEVGNEWGFVIDAFSERSFSSLLVAGHPGKLAKLISGHWNTHSSASPPACDAIARLARRKLGIEMPESPTVEGLFSQLETEDSKALGNLLAEEISNAISQRIGRTAQVAVFLVNMAGDHVAHAGDISTWEGEDHD